MVDCIIIEDEEQTRVFLRSLLNDYCDGVRVVGEASNVKDGVQLIKQYEHPLVFLDIEMPQENGFMIYKYFDKIHFEVIFTTAYSQYALQAIKMAALDYIIKPVALDELKSALDRYREKVQQFDQNQAQFKLLESAINKNPDQKMALATSDGYIFVRIKDIIRCQSNKSYTLFVLNDGQEIWTSKNLGEYESVLSQFGFKRVHRSHIINPDYIKRFIRSKSPEIIMNDGTSIAVSSAKKDNLLDDIYIP